MTVPDGTVEAGFIPLLDCAPLIIAREKGFAAAAGLELGLHKETSWATLRDRLAVGLLDAAHMLAPLPIAGNLGLAQLSTPLVVPMALCSGANTITVSQAVSDRMANMGAPSSFDAAGMLSVLARVIARRKAEGAARLTFGIVHPYSAHHYELAYWLAAGGIRPGREIDLVVVPPSLAAAALATRRIDGFCAGEPWGSVAVASGAGRVLLTNAHIWHNSPEKVLAVRTAWADADPDRIDRLVRAVHAAAVWCDAPENRDELAHILSSTHYIGEPRERLLVGLARRIPDPSGQLEPVEGFLNFAAKAQTFPWTSHALWFYSQMVRWDQAPLTSEAADIARATYRPDLYRRALAATGAVMPAANAKLEGAMTAETAVGSGAGRLIMGPDNFFDGRVFDPDRLAEYLAQFGDLSGRPPLS